MLYFGQQEKMKMVSGRITEMIICLGIWTDMV